MRSTSLLKAFRRASTGASEESLREVALELNVTFPHDYVAFMRESNGGEGPVGDEDPPAYLILYRVEELVSLNRGNVDFFPSWVFIGSDGGGEAVALKRGPEPTLALVPFIGDEEDALVGGHSFEEFIVAFATDAILNRR